MGIVTSLLNRIRSRGSIIYIAHEERTDISPFSSVKIKQHSRSRALYPGGIEALLCLLGLGASGQAKEEISTLIGSDENLISGLKALHDLNNSEEIQSHNALFLDRNMTISSEYLGVIYDMATISNEYDLINKPKQSARLISDWIESKSGFRNVVSVDALQNTTMVLVNTLCFKDEWVVPFRYSSTCLKTFTPLSGKKRQVFMMSQKADMGVFRNKRITAILKRFKNGATAEFVMGLSSKASFVESYDYQGQNVDLALPKFEHSETIDLKPLITEIKCGGIFVPGNFIELCGDEKACIGEAKQIISVAFDENGAEVKATTTSNMVSLGVDDSITIAFDHPFHYRITKGEIVLVSGFYNGD